MQTSNLNCSALDPARVELLLRMYGIAGEFIEFSGNVATIPLANRLHILRTMGVQVDTAQQLTRLLRKGEKARVSRWIPPVLPLPEESGTVALTLASKLVEEVLHWQLAPEQGGAIQGSFKASDLPLLESFDVAGRSYEKRSLELPVQPPGYYTLTVTHKRLRQETLLIVAPTQTWQPVSAAGKSRFWGLSAQLYTLRSSGNWGIGDFADLQALVDHAAACGADFILLNPLHILDLRYPENASPYSPSDRRFLNPLYIAAALSEDFQAFDVQRAFNSAEARTTLTALQDTAQVDYGGVANFKLKLLRLMYVNFCQQIAAGTTARTRHYADFVASGGTALQDFALFQAELFRTDGSAMSDAGFHLYLQWLACSQLESCQRRALEAGLSIGLIRDLAVGSSIDGSEVVENPGLFCAGARIGAPPDNYNPDGQNWGLPPLQPERLQATGFAHFIALLRSNMYSCGALRIDHVMALMRLWWCPDDGSNASGAYVHYPVDILFALLRLESVRSRCVIIGEDLGVVPPEIRHYLDDGGLFSNAVFYFEKYDGWHFRKPEHYKEQALAMIANHDVPPLASWWNANDLLLRRNIGLIGDDTKLASEQDFRTGEKGELLQWLAEQELLPASWQDRDVNRLFDPDLLLAIVSACGRVSARLVSLQIEDLVGVDTPVNIPGTSAEYSNWRRKIPVPLDEVFADTTTQGVLAAIREARSA